MAAKHGKTDTASKTLFDQLAAVTPPATDDLTALRAEMGETNAAVAALTEAMTQIVGMVTAPAPPEAASVSAPPPGQKATAASRVKKAGGLSETEKAKRNAEYHAAKPKASRPKAGVQSAGADGAMPTAVAEWLAANNMSLATPEVDPNPPHNVTTTRQGSTLLIAVDLSADIVPTEHGSGKFAYVATSGGNMKARMDLSEVTGIDGATMMLRISRPVS